MTATASGPSVPPPARPAGLAASPGQPSRAADDSVVVSAIFWLVRRWGLVLGLFVVAWMAVAGIRLTLGRQYETSVGLMAIQTPRSGQLGLAAAASLLGAGASGLQSSPTFIASLTTSRSVLDAVGRSVADSAHGRTVVELVARKPRSEIPPYEVARRLRKVVDVSSDRQSGVITVSVHHRDSLATRAALAALVVETQAAFRRVMRQQATEQRLAQARRVDSAAMRLRRAEEAQLSFIRANRVVSAAAESNLQRQRLQREVELAQTVYQQAATDRESAVARELEDAPAVVVVDAVPAYATPLPRHLASLLVGTTILLAVLLVVGAVAGHALKRRVSAHGPEWAALQEVSGTSRLARLALRYLDNG